IRGIPRAGLLGATVATLTPTLSDVAAGMSSSSPLATGTTVRVAADTGSSPAVIASVSAVIARVNPTAVRIRSGQNKPGVVFVVGVEPKDVGSGGVCKAGDLGNYCAGWPVSAEAGWPVSAEARWPVSAETRWPADAETGRAHLATPHCK